MTTAADRNTGIPHGEVWKDVVGFEGSYSVSSIGRVRSESHVIEKGFATVKTEAKIMNCSLDHYGYVQVTFSIKGKRFTRKVHAVVAEAFIGARPNGLDVAHANGVKTDNRVGNLRYCTRTDNCMDKVMHGTTRRGERACGAKLTRDKVLTLRADKRSQRVIAAQYGICQQTVSDIKAGRRWAWL